MRVFVFQYRDLSYYQQTGDVNSDECKNLKIWFALPILIAAWLVAFVPVGILRRYNKASNEDRKIWYTNVLSMCSMIVSGMFLGIAFLDLMPEIVQESHQVNPFIIKRFPVSHYIVVIGILLMIIVDQIIILFNENPVDTENPIERLNRPTPAIHLELPSIMLNIPRIVRPTLGTFHSLILLVSLGCHAFFKGQTMGKESSCREKIVELFAELLIHKIIVGFGIGLHLAQTGVSLISFIILSGCYAAMSPLGIISGYLFHDQLSNDTIRWSELLLEGVTCGVFIYVLFFKILPQELEQGRFRLMKLFNLISGYAVVCVIEAMSHENHHKIYEDILHT